MNFSGIPNFNSFKKITPVTKGWSGDKKFLIETSDGEKLLLRVSDIAELERKKTEYAMTERVYNLGVLTQQPRGFGLCGGGKNIYALSGWLEGEDIESLLPDLSETEQYRLGIKAGETLRRIHELPAPETAEPWGKRFRRKVEGRINFYNANEIKSGGGELTVQYLKREQGILDGRPQTFNHGDYNSSNLILTPGGQIGLIDFNGYNLDYGDPWWEFSSIPWGEEPSGSYNSGLINGYFNGEPPGGFFRVYAYYSAYDALAALCDTSVGEQGEPEDGVRHLKNVLRWFENMKRHMPVWYRHE